MLPTWVVSYMGHLYPTRERNSLQGGGREGKEEEEEGGRGKRKRVGGGREKEREEVCVCVGGGGEMRISQSES